MNDSIEQDDKKFLELFVKENSTLDEYLKGTFIAKNSIEADDQKMDELLGKQLWDDFQTPVRHDSIEEKYENEILIERVIRMAEKIHNSRLTDK